MFRRMAKVTARRSAWARCSASPSSRSRDAVMGSARLAQPGARLGDLRLHIQREVESGSDSAEGGHFLGEEKSPGAESEPTKEHPVAAYPVVVDLGPDPREAESLVVDVELPLVLCEDQMVPTAPTGAQPEPSGVRLTHQAHRRPEQARVGQQME